MTERAHGLPRISQETVREVNADFLVREDPLTFIKDSQELLRTKDPRLDTFIRLTAEMLQVRFGGTGTHYLLGGLLTWRMLEAGSPSLTPLDVNRISPETSKHDEIAKDIKTENPDLITCLEGYVESSPMFPLQSEYFMKGAFDVYNLVRQSNQA